MHLKTDFIHEKIFFSYKIGLTPVDLNQIFPMKPIGLEISLSAESYNKKLAENFRKIYDNEKHIVSKTINDIDSQF